MRMRVRLTGLQSVEKGTDPVKQKGHKMKEIPGEERRWDGV